MADRRGIARTRVAASFPVLVLALLAVACSPAASPSPSPAPSEAATPVVTAVPTESPAPTVLPTAAETGSTAAACTAADLKASHGIVEGAAGSRLTSVVLTAATACAVDAFPAFGIRDARGREMVGSAAAGTGRLDLDPDASYQVDVRFANWCGDDPAFPLELDLRIGAEVVRVTGSSFPDQGDMPPCNGSGGPELDAGGWEPAP